MLKMKLSIWAMIPKLKSTFEGRFGWKNQTMTFQNQMKHPDGGW